MDDLSQAIGNAIRSARVAAGLSQVEAAEVLGKSQGAISKYENGLVQAGYSELAAMASTYETDVGSFFSSTGTAPKRYSYRNTPPEVRRLEQRVAQLESPDRISEIARQAATFLKGAASAADPSDEVGGNQQLTQEEG